VLPALIRKMHEARESKATKVVVWGSGTPRREFLHSNDMADACLTLMGVSDEEFSGIVDGDLPPLINVGCGTDVSIRELAELIADVIGFSGSIVMDSTKPDGTPRKLLDITRLKAIGWRPTIDLESGIRRVYAHDFLARFKNGK
jgi:GDP-L-fucose synthase